jgi:hypothetical protein
LSSCCNGDFLRAAAEAALQIPMEADVEALIGAGLAILGFVAGNAQCSFFGGGARRSRIPSPHSTATSIR